MAKLKDLSMGRTEYQKFSIAIQQALKGVAEQYGVTFLPGNMTHDGSLGTMKVAVAIASKDGSAPVNPRLLKMEKDFKRNAFYFGLKDSHFGVEFKDSMNGRTLKIVGAKPRSSNPIIVEDIQTKKMYKYPDGFVKNCLQAEGKL